MTSRAIKILHCHELTNLSKNKCANPSIINVNGKRSTEFNSINSLTQYVSRSKNTKYNINSKALEGL